MKRTFDVSTKQDADSQPKVTKVTMTFPDGLPEWVMSGYEAFAVVKMQGNWRRKGIPAVAEVNAQDLAPGTRAPAATLEQQVAALTPEQRQALIAKLSQMK